MSTDRNSASVSGSSNGGHSSTDAASSRVDSATTIATSHIGRSETQLPIPDHKALKDGHGAFSATLTDSSKVEKSRATNRHALKELDLSSDSTIPRLEPDQIPIESPTRDEALGVSPIRGDFEDKSRCWVATNHYYLTFPNAPESDTRPLIFYEYEIKIVPEHFGRFENPPLVSAPQRKLIITAGSEQMQYEGKCSMTTVVTDYRYTLVSMLPLHSKPRERLQVPVCVSRSNHVSGDFTLKFRLRGQWHFDRVSGLRELGARSLQLQSNFTGSKRQLLLNLLLSRYIDDPAIVRGAKGDLLNTSESVRLMDDKGPTGMSLIRSYGLKIISTGENAKLLQISTSARPCFYPRLLETILRDHQEDGRASDDKDSYTSIEAALQGLSMRVGTRALTVDAHGNELRPYLDEPLHYVKRFSNLGECDPSFEKSPHYHKHDPFGRSFEEEEGRSMIKTKNKAKTRHMIEYQKKRHEWQNFSLPAANMGSKEHQEWFPSSKLTLLAHQQINGDVRAIHKTKTTRKQLVSTTRNTPLERSSLISGFMADFFNQQKLGSSSLFHDRLRLSKEMLHIRAKTLALPDIQHGKTVTKLAERGNWGFSDKLNIKKEPKEKPAYHKFRKPFPHRLSVGVIFSRPRPNRIVPHDHLEKLLHKLSQAGLNTPTFQELEYKVLSDYSRSAATVTRELETIADELGPKDLIILYSDTGKKIAPSLYAAFKRTMDLSKARVSVCLRAENESRLAENLCGIAAKINAKLSQSYNHTVKLRTDDRVSVDDTMILGATVLHPVRSGAPSIVSLVSCDSGKGGEIDEFCHYRGTIGLQMLHSADEYGERPVQIIQDLGSLLKPHLKAFKDKHGSRPQRLIYYRAGINDEFIRNDSAFELEQLLKACATQEEGEREEEASSTSITIIAVQKQSNVRFFPLEREDGPVINDNCKPGTIVDEILTGGRDFFLQSHYTKSGTARPTHYTVVRHGGVATSIIQNLSFKLCFGSQIATQALSQPVPTYYAGKLALRVRLWLRDLYLSNPQEEVDEQFMTPRAPPEEAIAIECSDEDKRRAESTTTLAAYRRSLNSVDSDESNTQPWLGTDNSLQDCMFWL